MSYTFRLLTFSPLDKAKPEEIDNDSDMIVVMILRKK